MALAPGTKVYLGFGSGSGVEPIAQPPRFGTVTINDGDNNIVLWETCEVSPQGIPDAALDTVAYPLQGTIDTYLYKVVRFLAPDRSQEYTAQVVDVFTENSLFQRLILKTLKGDLWFRAFPTSVVLVDAIGLPQ